MVRPGTLPGMLRYVDVASMCPISNILVGTRQVPFRMPIWYETASPLVFLTNYLGPLVSVGS